MATLGMQAEARDALAFYLDAEAGRFQDWSELASYDMPPYQISLVRYYGFGVEETDFNAFGPNLEFDGFGLFLWALRAYERTTGDETLADEHWALVSERVADVLVALIEPSTGLLRPDSSIWETHWNGRERHWAYTNITAVRGLCDAAEIAERNGDDARAQTYRDTAESVRDAIAERLTDGDGFIASNLEELEAGAGYYDAAVIDAIAMGLFDPEGAIAGGTLAGLDRQLLVEASEVGWSRNDDRTDHDTGEDVSPWGSDYDSAEWVITDLRGAVATRLAGDEARSDAILQWVLAQSDANYLMVAETYEENTGEYKFNTPMLGFGAGAYALALAARAGDVDTPACGEYYEGGDGGTESSSGSGSESGSGPSSDTMSTTGPSSSNGTSDPITISESLDGSSDTDPGGVCPEGSNDCPSSCSCTTDRSPAAGVLLLALLGLLRRRRAA
jgi:MYXO-CTERM domain-containing protein